ncbi:MAG: hypothetical protein MJZ34_08285 [Paludibacteraceae bacterium]|nr:hypothetical protein [Paludibacteraceae bacterium]
MYEKSVAEKKFSQKLIEEYGIDVDWNTHHKTPCSHLRGGDPNTCTHFVQLVDDNGNASRQTLLLYHPLSIYNRKNVKLIIVNESSKFENDLKYGDLKCLFTIEE